MLKTVRFSFNSSQSFHSLIITFHFLPIIFCFITLEQPILPQTYETAQWKKIDGTVRDILLDHPLTYSAELLYSTVDTLSTPQFAENTFKKLTLLLDDCLSVKFTTLIQFAIISYLYSLHSTLHNRNYRTQTGIDFLTSFCQLSDHFLEHMQLITNLFGCLNQKFCVPARTSIKLVILFSFSPSWHSFSELGLSLFRKYILLRHEQLLCLFYLLSYRDSRIYLCSYSSYYILRYRKTVPFPTLSTLLVSPPGLFI